MTLASEDTAPGLLGSLTHLSRFGWPVAVADGGSPPWFLARLRQLPEFDVQSVEGPNLIKQVAAAVARARQWETPHVLYTEPDKEVFFTQHLPTFIGQALAFQTPGIALAARSSASFATFPDIQRFTEQVLNTLCGSVTGLEADYTYGPFLIDSSLLGDFDELPPSVGWGWRPYVFARAHGLGARLSCITGEFVCPPDDRGDGASERTHRMRQLAQNVMGLVRAAERER